MGFELSGQLGSIMMRSMVIDMNDNQLHTLAQIQAFLGGTAALEFSVSAEERYGFIARTVRRFGYAGLKRAENAQRIGLHDAELHQLGSQPVQCERCLLLLSLDRDAFGLGLLHRGPDRLPIGGITS
jgi:hypothetical protein